MRALPGSVQTLIDADAVRPIVTATITLRDNATTLYLATQDITISSQAYVGDLIDVPRLSISTGEGVDHLRLELTDTTDETASPSPYWTYEVNDEFDGATCVVNMYFATDATYSTLEGPVGIFDGVISEPIALDDRIVLTVMSRSRVNVGTLGRKISKTCLNDFKSANCGYTNSATITGALTAYAAGDEIPIDTTGSPSVQAGIALKGEGVGFLGNQNHVRIVRGGSTVVVQDAVVTESNLGASWVKLDTAVTAQSGDVIEYMRCPRDSMENCGRRWKVGNTTPQTDRFMGFDYHYPELPILSADDVGILARFLDGPDIIVPICYGQRWVSPLLVGVHAATTDSNKEWAAWNSTFGGPFVIALISEGPVESGIIEARTNAGVLSGVLLDDTPLDWVPNYAAGDQAQVSISLGSTSPTVSDLNPRWEKSVAENTIAGFGGLPNVAYCVIDLPDDYDLQPVAKGRVRVEGGLFALGGARFIPGSTILPPGSQFVTKIFQAKEPDIRLYAKGRKVETWSYVGATPTKNGSTTFTRNPVWQILDLISAPQRAAVDDVFSAGIPESGIDHASFIDWAGYAAESVNAYDAGGSLVSTERFRSDLYIDNATRASALAALLTACRGTLVERDGKVGIVCEAPRGGTGTATSGTTTTLVDTNRNGATLPSWPTSGVQGLLEGYKVEILSGTGAGQIRTIASNTANTVTVTSAWDVGQEPDNTSEYVVYAVRLNSDNVGKVEFKRKQPTHSVTNEIVATFDVNSQYGREGSVRVQATGQDGFGETYVDRFGKNSRSLALTATTDYSYAVRQAWYTLQRDIVTNRQLMVSDANVEAMPLEIGDVVTVSHPTAGLASELFMVTRKVSKPNLTYDLTLSLYRDEVYLDWPTYSPDGIQIRSRFRSAHEVPPHVTSLTVTKTERDNAAPIINVSWVRPPWEYPGAKTIVEASTDGGTTFVEVGRSDFDNLSFAALAGTSYTIRAVFVSHTNTRADDSLVIDTASGGSATTLVDTGRSYETDLYTGWTVLLREGVTGPPSEETALITSNTNDTITVGSTWANAPASGDTYEVFRPAPSTSITTSDTAAKKVTLLQWLGETKETPGDPTNLSAVEGSTQNTVDLTWNDNATDELEYHIQRAPDVTGSPGTWVTISDTEAANSTSYTDSDTTTLSTQAIWWYRVRCRSIYGFSAYSNEADVDLDEFN
jgi:hypothetical protein